jgi:hypothetical protein
MSKKDLASVTTNLQALAEPLPVQRAARPADHIALPSDPPRRQNVKTQDRNSELSLRLRKSQRKELSRLAQDADMTMRAFVLIALRDKGLSVREDDLTDMRLKMRGEIR